MAVQAELARGDDGAGKPMTCSASVLAKVTQLKPRDLNDLTRIMGERHAERFGPAFLDVLREA